MTVLASPRAKKREISASELKKMRDKDHIVVSGIFRCYEPRGGEMIFSYKKYKGDEVLQYKMKDVVEYQVPAMVAKHLNQNCYYNKHSYVLDSNGDKTICDGKKIHRCSFESMEFQDLEKDIKA